MRAGLRERESKLLARKIYDHSVNDFKLVVYQSRVLWYPWHVLQEQPHRYNDYFDLLNGEEQSNLYHQCLANHPHLRLALKPTDSLTQASLNMIINMMTGYRELIQNQLISKGKDKEFRNLILASSRKKRIEKKNLEDYLQCKCGFLN